jgi:hypothetical protein
MHKKAHSHEVSDRYPVVFYSFFPVLAVGHRGISDFVLSMADPPAISDSWLYDRPDLQNFYRNFPATF